MQAKNAGVKRPGYKAIVQQGCLAKPFG